jgi:hypothetical protein
VANPVPNPVQRLRYFDGEYLRSYDFTDEQTYHIEMRRLMNLKLHLYGIIYGLELVMDQNSGAPPYFFSVAPGMAIDRIGREIVVPAPYSLSNVLTAPGLGPGSYEVWICYQESQTGLPAAGYLDCNVQNQNTRWQETFQVYLQPMQGPSLVADCGGVRLGTVTLTNSSGLGLQFTNQTYNTRRHYVGIRAQSVIAPDQLDTDQFHMNPPLTQLPDKPLAGYLDVHPGVFNHGNMFVKKNLVVGDDFQLDNTVYTNLPDVTTIPPGNLKVTQDLFLQGDFYGFLNNNWYKLEQYIQTLTPSIVTGTATILISPQGTNITTGLFALTSPITSPIVTSATPQVMLAISGIQWEDPQDFETNFGTSTSGIQVSVQLSGITQASPGSNQWNMVVQWSASPNVASGGGYVFPVTQVSINYLVVFLPS